MREEGTIRWRVSGRSRDLLAAKMLEVEVDCRRRGVVLGEAGRREGAVVKTVGECLAGQVVSPLDEYCGMVLKSKSSWKEGSREGRRTRLMTISGTRNAFNLLFHFFGLNLS